MRIFVCVLYMHKEILDKTNNEKEEPDKWLGDRLFAIYSF